MARPEKPLNPKDGPAATFALMLRTLREACGGMKYQQMGKRVGYSAPTLAAAASGKRLPTWSVTFAYITACGVQDDHLVAFYRSLWLNAKYPDDPIATAAETELGIPRQIDRYGCEPHLSGYQLWDTYLSAREEQVLQLLAAGYSNRQMAQQLELAEKTVATYLSRLYPKLDATCRSDAVAAGYRMRILDPNRDYRNNPADITDVIPLSRWLTE